MLAYKSALEECGCLKKSNEAFRAHCEAVAAGFNLESRLVCPLSRYPRYQLLWRVCAASQCGLLGNHGQKEEMKHAPEGQWKTAVIAAFQKMHNVLVETNATLRWRETFVKLTFASRAQKSLLRGVRRVYIMQKAVVLSTSNDSSKGRLWVTDKAVVVTRQNTVVALVQFDGTYTQLALAQLQDDSCGSCRFELLQRGRAVLRFCLPNQVAEYASWIRCVGKALTRQWDWRGCAVALLLGAHERAGARSCLHALGQFPLCAVACWLRCARAEVIVQTN
eukprot:TRINITY_DN1860_c0_g1_i6.p1 TRINITY_DN1860_c0_g1~~TRINITY_DN1860_c0_g1_i6.p1  ORF type:complete len:278 (+),score=42.50 TRINITY_DN1860_c0_g1_i6:352-1185(+)